MERNENKTSRKKKTVCDNDSASCQNVRLFVVGQGHTPNGAKLQRKIERETNSKRKKVEFIQRQCSSPPPTLAFFLFLSKNVCYQ